MSTRFANEPDALPPPSSPLRFSDAGLPDPTATPNTSLDATHPDDPHHHHHHHHHHHSTSDIAAAAVLGSKSEEDVMAVVDDASQIMPDSAASVAAAASAAAAATVAAAESVMGRPESLGVLIQPASIQPAITAGMVIGLTPPTTISGPTTTTVKRKRKTYNTEEERRQARILKNRRTAEESRQRRMKKMKELEEYVATSAVREKELLEEVRLGKIELRTMAENMESLEREKDAIIARKDEELEKLKEQVTQLTKHQTGAE